VKANGEIFEPYRDDLCSKANRILVSLSRHLLEFDIVPPLWHGLDKAYVLKGRGVHKLCRGEIERMRAKAHGVASLLCYA